MSLRNVKIKQAKRLLAAGAAVAGLGFGSIAFGQTLPIAGNPQQAAIRDRDSIQGVREQDEAALRASGALNHDARQQARQAINFDARPGSEDANLRRDAQGDLRNTAAMNSGLRGADLG